MDFSKLMDNEYYRTFLEKIDLSEISNINFSEITSTLIYIALALITSAFLLWLLKAIGLYTMARKNGDEYAFLAFIPYGCLYTKGKIIGKTKLFGIEISHPEWILPLLLVAKMLPFGKMISMFLFTIFYYGILYRIYQKQTPNFAIILLILSIIIPFTQPFILFFIRNADSKS